ncbi:MFS transporter [Kineosporia sp. J2-2]|uniref:MFS transporter n=1 Tax=Kineosporia corallincola TaxID=2835133 RepID=A0ABS5TN85_9ACTN|nr:MFS transporter [Kineosporia corallincola]MBT0772561.1 MFS transporter [Kineosporia corallincola]
MSSPDLARGSTAADGVTPGVVLAFLCIAQFMVFLDVSIVNVALPTIEAGLSIPENQLPWLVTAYGLMLGGCLLSGARLGDRFGRRRILRTGLLLFGLASLAAGLAGDPIVLFVARGVQGFGAALMAPSALSTLTATFEEGPDRNRALGIWGALTGLAPVAGNVLGGVLSEGPGWRWIFFINVPIAVLAVLFAPRILPETRTAAHEKFDIVGAALLTGGLLALIHTLAEAIEKGWSDPLIIGGIVVATGLLTAFVMVERHISAPLVPFSIFRNSTLRTADLATLFLLGCVVTIFFFASLFMQQVLGYSAVRTGLSYLPLALIVGVGAGVASNVSSRAAAKPVLLIGLTLVTAGMISLWQLPTDASYATRILPTFLVTGLGMGLSFVPLQIAAQIGVHDREAGLAAGLINTSQELGGALGVAVAATIAFRRVDELTAWANGDPARTDVARASVFHDAFLVGGCFALTALVLSAVLLPMMRAGETG